MAYSHSSAVELAILTSFLNAAVQTILADYTWGERRIIDIGGALGSVLDKVLRENTVCEGVLFDQPEVLIFLLHIHSDRETGKGVWERGRWACVCKHLAAVCPRSGSTPLRFSSQVVHLANKAMRLAANAESLLGLGLGHASAYMWESSI